jgi:Flp pilus assembly protein TadB
VARLPRPRRAAQRRGEIRLGWYAAALVGYVVAGYFLKSVLLNWLVGPLFLLIVLYLVPTLVRRLGRRPRTEPAE